MSRFQPLLSASELPIGRGMTARAGDREIALFNVDGTIYALEGRCPHRGGLLGEGYLQDGQVFCPLHGWCFIVKSGTCIDRPDKPAVSLPARIVNGQIEVSL